jgi:hypothetical protein
MLLAESSLIFVAENVFMGFEKTLNRVTLEGNVGEHAAPLELAAPPR